MNLIRWPPPTRTDLPAKSKSTLEVTSVHYQLSCDFPWDLYCEQRFYGYFVVWPV